MKTNRIMLPLSEAEADDLIHLLWRQSTTEKLKKVYLRLEKLMLKEYGHA